MQTQVNVHLDGGERVERDSIDGHPRWGVVRIGHVTVYGDDGQLDALLDDLAALRSDEAAKEDEADR